MSEEFSLGVSAIIIGFTLLYVVSVGSLLLFTVPTDISYGSMMQLVNGARSKKGQRNFFLRIIGIEILAVSLVCFGFGVIGSVLMIFAVVDFIMQIWMCSVKVK